MRQSVESWEELPDHGPLSRPTVDRDEERPAADLRPADSVRPHPAAPGAPSHTARALVTSGGHGQDHFLRSLSPAERDHLNDLLQRLYNAHVHA